MKSKKINFVISTILSIALGFILIFFLANSSRYLSEYSLYITNVVMVSLLALCWLPKKKVVGVSLIIFSIFELLLLVKFGKNFSIEAALVYPFFLTLYFFDIKDNSLIYLFFLFLLCLVIYNSTLMFFYAYWSTWVRL